MSSPYITPEGHARLREELDHLWRRRRPEVVRALSAAAAEGDRSENAEYIYRKKELREIDRRVRYLTKRLEALKVVDRLPDDPDRVFFGAWVTVADEAAEERTYRVVGADEVETGRGWISADSPMARAVRGKSVGDICIVHLPTGPAEIEIVEVRYTDPADRDGKFVEAVRS
ncbi:transcription elongation factor GreB [uncultured Abyssibacter sp.]|uniref:transcription elongation factor GreB n=1 Tax=uncultured Abyssibacter sp. TaxID=2320202 RepID=UPI0032B27B4C